MKVDLHKIDEPDPIELTMSDEERDSKNIDPETLSMAYAVMGEATSCGYERIRKKINDINPDRPLPSVYHLNKQLPVKIEALELQLCKDVNYNAIQKETKDELLYGSSFNDTTPRMIKNEDEALMLLSQNEPDQSIAGAKLVGDMDDYIQLITKKHEVNLYRMEMILYC